MTWKKHFKTSNTILPAGTRVAMPGAAMSNQPTWLPEVYQGPADRLMRYMQYDQMDLDDTVNAALDTIAEFSTQVDEKTGLPIGFAFTEEPNPSEVKILERTLNQWIKLNQIKKRVFRIFRSTCKYGDQFFIRDPETFRLIWVDPAKVDKVIVNESEGKKLEVYYIRDIDLNLQALVATKISHTYDHGYGRTPPFANVPQATAPQMYSGYSAVTPGGMPDFAGAYEKQVTPVDAAHVVHISLTEGMDNNWPFGNSILEAIYKVYKQKELLEDSILIYRVHRAPERRIFTIDVGDMPANKAQAYLERVKLEVQQKRIPNRNSDGNSVIDSTYNPMCETLSTKIPLLDGRVLTLREIIDEHNDGKELWIYSIDEKTGRIAPGLVSWAGVTRGNAEIVRVSVSNGKELTCTPDHPIPVLGKGFVRADELQADDPLYNFDVRIKTLQDGSEITQIYDYELADWINASDMVGEFFTAHNVDSKPMFGNPWESSLDGEFKNHRVVSVEHLDELEDTGTITVDMKETYHDYHTFATEAGIFIQNSMLEDYFFASSCLKLDTGIPLLDGRTLSLEEIIQEHEEGKVNYTYSQSDSMELEPGKIVWAGVTRKNAQVIRIYLDNNEYLETTPDHRFIRRDGSAVEAQHLTEGDSLMPLYLIDAKTSPDQKQKPYLRYIDNKDEKVKWVHTAICPKAKPGRETEIHHIDFNSKNNNPGNLVEMDTQEHRDLHKKAGTYSLGRQWNSKDGREKLIEGIRKLYVNRTEEFDKMLTERNRKNGSRTLSKDNPNYRRNLAKVKKAIREVAESRRYNFSDEMFRIMKKCFDNGYNSVSKLCKALKDDKEFQLECERMNNGLNEAGKFGVTDTTLNRIVKTQGFKTFGDWKESYTGIKKFSNRTLPQNHKVTKIEWLDERFDTGDITVETPSGSHIFATAAGVFIHNSEGRGSTVTTLPGGCFSMDTKVSLLSGEEASIAEIGNRIENGEQLWTYSCHPLTGAVRPGQISWAGVTQKSAKVMKIRLSNGAEIACTPDHKFPKFEIGFVEAKDLSTGDRLIPLRRSNIFNYEIFHDPCMNQWEYTHRMVMDEIDGSVIFDDNTIIHHIDYNRFNNNPKNLCFMDFDEHRKLFNELSMNVEARSATLEEYNERVRWVGEIKELGDVEPAIDITVESVEYLDEEIEVGTIRVDDLELLHDYHTFALSAGVFTKNSNLGEIDDLKYFNNKMLRALRVPSAYWPTGPEDGTNVYTDGRVGTAFIQEYRFTKYCQRLQQLIIENLDLEFKLFLKHRGFTIDNGIFNLEFTEPQNFAKYRMIEIDSAHAGVFTQLEGIPYLSKRFKMKRYLGLDDDEILENERLWREEQTDEEPPDEEVTPGMRAVGVEPFGDDFEGPDLEGEPGEEGEEGIEGVGGPEEGGEETPPA